MTASLAALVGCLAGSPVRAAPEPATTRAAPELVAEAVAKLPDGACRDLVRAEFVDGRRSADACETTRSRAARALWRRVPRGTVLGVVESRRVDLAGVHLILSTARRCRGWALLSPGRAVLEPVDADRAKCRVRRYRGPLRVTLVGHDGARYVGVHEAASDVDGHVTVRFAELDAELQSRRLPALESFARMELGVSGWAGVLDLERMRQFIADWHFEWVRLGRGTPALFAVRHQGHPRAAAARALATEATLARQERDYLAVARGELAPRVFLTRYAWSPYLHSVRTMAQERDPSGTR